MSREKSRLFCAQNMHEEAVERLSTILGMGETKDLGKYLESRNPQKSNKETFQAMVDKMKSRASKWQPIRISLSGGSLLPNQPLPQSQCMLMQSTCLPKSTCEELDKIQRGFI